jgi:Domain of unknown function (DU1801)
MTTNKTQPTKVPVPRFISALESADKREDAAAIVRMMQDATGEKPRMWGPSIIGFGEYHYVYESGHGGDAPIVSFSPRKSAIVLYIMPGFSDFEALLSRLGKHTTGKACIYIKKLADIDQAVLKELVIKSVAVMRTRYPAPESNLSL